MTKDRDDLGPVLVIIIGLSVVAVVGAIFFFTGRF